MNPYDRYAGPFGIAVFSAGTSAINHYPTTQISWAFYTSRITEIGGPSDRLKYFLASNGIDYNRSAYPFAFGSLGKDSGLSIGKLNNFNGNQAVRAEIGRIQQNFGHSIGRNIASGNSVMTYYNSNGRLRMPDITFDNRSFLYGRTNFFIEVKSGAADLSGRLNIQANADAAYMRQSNASNYGRRIAGQGLRVAGAGFAAFDLYATQAQVRAQIATGDNLGAGRTVAEYGGRTGGAIAGAWTGAAIGAAYVGGIGSVVVPVLGAIPGAIFGGIVGSIGGAFIGSIGGEWGARSLYDGTVAYDLTASPRNDIPLSDGPAIPQGGASSRYPEYVGPAYNPDGTTAPRPLIITPKGNEPIDIILIDNDWYAVPRSWNKNATPEGDIPAPDASETSGRLSAADPLNFIEPWTPFATASQNYYSANFENMNLSSLSNNISFGTWYVEQSGGWMTEEVGGWQDVDLAQQGYFNPYGGYYDPGIYNFVSFSNDHFMMGMGFYFPIAIDLDGQDGIEIEAWDSSNVYFDMTGDGRQNRTAWAGAGDAILAYDANNDGVIDQRNEIVFTDWDPSASSDMEALRNVFDTNNNGLLDSGDAEWSKFKLIVTNIDGSTSLQSLSSQVTSIALTPNQTRTTFEDEAPELVNVPVIVLSGLSEAQRRALTLAELLGALRLLTPLDRTALAAYCAAYGLWAQAIEEVETYGAMVKSPTGFPIQSPWLAIVNRQSEIMIRMASEFGFTPASRARIVARKDEQGSCLKASSETGDWNQPAQTDTICRRKLHRNLPALLLSLCIKKHLPARQRRFRFELSPEFEEFPSFSIPERSISG